MTRASGSTFSRIFAAMARRARARSTAGRFDHPFCAVWAAEMAASTSAAVLSGTVQMGSPVDGLKHVTRSAPVEGVNLPLMKLS